MKPKKRQSQQAIRFSFGHHYPPAHYEQLTSLARIKVPRAIRITTWLCVLTMVMISMALRFVPWVQTSSGMGMVTTLAPGDRLQHINAMVPGRIAEWYVRDGDSVKAGDPIVRIQDVDLELLPRLQAQLAAAKRKLEAVRGAVATARLDNERQRGLYEEGLVSRLKYEQSKIKVQQLIADEEEASAAVNRAQVNLSRNSSQLVRAPRDGAILRLAAGDQATMVSTGQELASFMPANVERAVEIYIDGRDIGLVHPGRIVRLQFEGWPAFQFSGMPDIAIGTFAGEVAFVEPSARADGRFRVLVKERKQTQGCRQVDGYKANPTGRNNPRTAYKDACSWPPESYVRFGAKARGWILLETVPLGFELWRQLNNFPPLKPAINDQTKQH